MEYEGNTDSFKLKIFDKLEKDMHINEYGFTSSYLYYKSYDNNERDMAKLLRDTLFKIDSLIKLLEALKKGNIEWSSNINEIQELQALLEEKSN